MRRLIFPALLCGLALAQTNVTLNGSSYPLWDNPVGLLDGPCAMGAWSSGTAYHSLEAVSYNGTWYRAIAQSGPGTAAGPVTPGSNANYWVASANNLTGSGAKFTCNMWGTSGSGRAQSSNPAFVASQAGANTEIATGYAAAAGAEISWKGVSQNNGDAFGTAFNCALQWVAEGAPDQANDRRGYLACAEAAVLNAEDFFMGAAMCDQTQSQCGSFGAQTDYDSYWTPWLATIYGIVRDKLTTDQRATFVNKVWNDNSSSNNGLGVSGNPTGSCIPPAFKSSASGTITTHSWGAHLGGSYTVQQTMTVTGAGTHFTVDLVVGDVLYGIGHVASIQNDTDLTLVAPAADDISGQALNVTAVAGWNDANQPCGLVWYLKHHSGSPPVGAGNYAASYPRTGGTYSGPFINLTLTKLSGYLPLAFATAADDARAATAATQYYDYWYKYTQAYVHQEPTGYYRPRAYTTGRDMWMLCEIILALNDAVPSLSASGFLGWWSKGIETWPVYASENDQPYGYGLPWAGDFQITGGYALRSALMAAALYPGSAEAAQVNYWQKTTRGDYSATVPYNPYTVQSSSQQAGILMIYTDPGNAGTAPSTLSTQYIWDQTDLNPNGGPTAAAQTCHYPGAYPGLVQGDCRQNYWISRTGFAGTDDIVQQQNPWWDGEDHQADNGPHWGAVTIYRQSYLLGGDDNMADGNYDAGSAMIEIGGASNWHTATDQAGWTAAEIRWAGQHPTGVATNKYAYSEVDLATNYLKAPTHALREVAHLKGGSQDYVVIHDWVSDRTPTTIQASWPLFVGPDYFSRSNTVSSSSWASAQTAQVATPHSSLIIQALPTNSNSLATIDLGMGTNNFAHLLQTCASTDGTSCSSSATSMEEIIVAEPANTTSPSMPPLTQPSGGPNWAVVQIADSSSPKVAAFAKGPATQSSLSFTSTHSGTAQYMVAGLTPGTYSVTVDGAAVSGSPFTVVRGDNTLYFEGAAGLYSIVSTGTTASGH